MKLKKVLSLVLCAAMITGMTAGCGSTKDDSSSDKGEVYYLSFKPELTKQWEDIAKKYEQKTGVKVKVVTAASGQYEQTLKSEIAKKDAPTLFQINGPVGYQNWKDYGSITNFVGLPPRNVLICYAPLDRMEKQCCSFITDGEELGNNLLFLRRAT